MGGYIYADYGIENEIEISIGVSTKVGGRGVATEALQELVRILQKNGISDFVAYIREDNFRSQRVFTKVGFKKTEIFRHTKLETEKEEIKLYRWVLNS